jgi:hypothetical protein
LSLEIDDENDENIDHYIWTYSDLNSGWGIDSELSYNAPDEEVIAFFKTTHLKNTKEPTEH